ncbi:uncharacterized protein LY89DRAFT_79868 [Mollisia scopiformis]|uniref:Uncharacterized protein n=1 Tax=Mollisia scopiformis TaxID=149040 RepID=A0A194X875_MOLSC|nr:uncharacterized protein LY89DRAFT_79868 [Mollisia scopiformis]KUJ16314.1 hypothetical protein LY89DRAFT_79868 [Mollisia scopiformis]
MVIAVTPSFFCFLLAVCGYYILKGLGILFRRHRTDDLLQFVIKLFVVAALVVYNYSLMGLGIGGIGISWKKQMKNSCQGFDTRVNLDIYIKGDGNPHFPSHKLSLYTPDLPNPPPHQLGIDDFEFTSPIDSSKSPSEPYHTYHRMTGTLSPSQHLAIDFDLPNHLWRIMNLTYTDPSLNPTTSFPGTARTLFKSGTWSPTNETNPHAFIPELSLQIPNLYYYTRHCAYQPFMKVYTTTNLNATQITEQGNRTWSPLNEKEVVMRTAAFGYLPEKLEVCARRNEYEVNGTKMHGLREDVVVPLGLLAALRLQMRADGKFERGCEYVGA